MVISGSITTVELIIVIYILGGSVTSESLLFSSMTTSLQLAQECLKDNEPNKEETTSQQTFDGLESFAQTIESGT